MKLLLSYSASVSTEIVYGNKLKVITNRTILLLLVPR